MENIINLTYLYSEKINYHKKYVYNYKKESQIINRIRDLRSDQQYLDKENKCLNKIIIKSYTEIFITQSYLATLCTSVTGLPSSPNTETEEYSKDVKYFLNKNSRKNFIPSYSIAIINIPITEPMRPKIEN